MDHSSIHSGQRHLHPVQRLRFIRRLRHVPVQQHQVAQVALSQDAELIILNRDPTPFDAHATKRGNGDIIEELLRLFGPLESR